MSDKIPKSGPKRSAWFAERGRECAASMTEEQRVERAKKGNAARNANMTPEERSALARKAANARHDANRKAKAKKKR